MKQSILVKKQVKEFKAEWTDHDGLHAAVAEVRYDDQCGNGHNSFAITGSVYGRGGSRRDGVYYTTSGKVLTWESGGCVHEVIAEHIPELAPYIKWHLCSSDGPMHYIANTMYWASEHGPEYAWVYYKGPKASDPLGLGDDGEVERLLGYLKPEEARKAEGQPGYRVEWDMKTVKIRNLDHARSAAIWPEATDEELMNPNLKEVLEARLPKLMEEFCAAVESLGFVY